jgi:serine protease Do
MNPDAPNGRKVAILGIAIASVGLAAAGVMLRPASGARPEPTFVKEPPRDLNPSDVRPASELSNAFIAVSEAVTSAVVRIEAEQTNGAKRSSWFSRSLPEFFATPADSTVDSPEISGGSGFIVSSNGYILTNFHVIEGADRITVSLADKRSFVAQVIGVDPSTDVAVIRIEAENLPAVSLGNSDSARVGEWVLAIGNPGFDDASTLDFTVTSGIISAKGRPLRILGNSDEAGPQYAIEDFIQTDAVINPGNSGGPLVDIKGRVIGINTAIATTTGYNQGYGFAIPMNLAQRVMSDLIAHGYVRRALLRVSIREVAAEDAEIYRLPRIAGVVVEDYEDRSPAHAAGLNRNDVIIAVDGTNVESVSQLQRIIALHQPGETVTLSVIRYGVRRSVRVRLAEAVNRTLAQPGPPAPVPGGLGIEVKDLDKTLAQQLGYERAGGVIVSVVTRGSAADRKLVGEGDRLLAINDQKVANAREARRLLHGFASGKVVSLLIERPEGTTYIANIRIP